MKDPESSEPFTPEELASVLQHSERDASPWIHHSALFLAYAGAHISVLSGGFRQETVWDSGRVGVGRPRIEYVYSDPIRSDAVRGNGIYWRRPKNEKPIPMPISRYLEGWLPTWLDEPRPTTSRRYRQVFDRIGDNSGLQVNPLRFRHTCAVRLYHIMEMKPEVVCRLLGVSPITLLTYIAQPKWMVAQELKAKGW
jgi:hypothetical protein